MVHDMRRSISFYLLSSRELPQIHVNLTDKPAHTLDTWNTFEFLGHDYFAFFYDLINSTKRTSWRFKYSIGLNECIFNGSLTVVCNGRTRANLGWSWGAGLDNHFLRELGRIPQNGKNWSPVEELHNLTGELSLVHASPQNVFSRA